MRVTAWLRGWQRISLKDISLTKGHAVPGWSKVSDTFRKLLVSRVERGGAVSVYHKGKEVVRMVGGYADPESKVPWELDTLSTYQSTTKIVTAVVVGMLVDSHLLEFTRPVREYWPEFAQNGKEAITVEQLMSHQAGLVVIDEPYSLYDILGSPDKVGRALAMQKPNWPPGSAHGYHGFTLGLLVDQLVRRVDPTGRSLSKFFDEEVAKPFGIDLFIGMPLRENYRCARVKSMPFASLSILKSYDHIKMVLQMLLNTDSFMYKMSKNPQEISTPGILNSPWFRQVPNASLNGFGTGQSMAKLGSILANGGSINNKILLSPGTMTKITEPMSLGMDRDIVTLLNSVWGRGVMLFPKRIPTTNALFGHPGMGGQTIFIDPTHEVSWSYLTNHYTVSIMADDTRNIAIQNAIYDVLGNLDRN